MIRARPVQKLERLRWSDFSSKRGLCGEAEARRVIVVFKKTDAAKTRNRAACSMPKREVSHFTHRLSSQRRSVTDFDASADTQCHHKLR